MTKTDNLLEISTRIDDKIGSEFIRINRTRYNFPHGKIESIDLNEMAQRELIAWFKENRPEILRDVMCEDCPEVC